MNDQAAVGAGAGEIKKASRWIIMLGILILVLGIIVIGMPHVAGTAAMIYIGVLLLLGGLVELFGAFRAGGWRAGALAFLSGAFSVAGGIIILARPLFGLAVLTLILAVYLLVDGIGRIVLALRVRPERGWGLVLAGGVATLVLGVFIWRHWPLSGLWAIGTLIGINMIIHGWTMITLGGATRALVYESSE